MRARGERERWRVEGWSRSSRGWVVRRRIGKAIRSCQGPMHQPLRTLIHPTERTASPRSFPDRYLIFALLLSPMAVPRNQIS